MERPLSTDIPALPQPPDGPRSAPEETLLRKNIKAYNVQPWSTTPL